ALIEQPPRIAPQIQHQAAQAARALLAQQLELLLQQRVRRRREDADLDVAEAVDDLALDRLQLVTLAPYPEGQLTTAPIEHQHHLAARRPLHARHHLVELQVRHLGAVDSLDDVTRLDPGARGRRSLDGRDDDQPSLALLDV